MIPGTETVDLLIESRWIAPVEPNVLLENHAIAVRRGRIVALLPASAARERFQATDTLQLDDHILIPGLINLHTHAAMSLMRGLADDLPLMTWLQQHIWPTEAALVSPEFVRDGTLLACAEMLLGGITCFNDMYFFPDAAAEAVDRSGIRAALGLTVLDFPNAYASDADDYLNKGLATRERWLNHPRLSFCLAPHAPYTVGNRSFQRVQTLADQLDLPIHLHIHETQDEINDSESRFGLRPLARLDQLGLLGPNLIGVHAVHLLPTEIELLAKRGCHIAHCPSSNLKLGSGIAPVPALQAAGINIGLGTDGAASNNRLDLFAEMRLAALLGKGCTGSPTTLNALAILDMATLNGARALGLEKRIGSLKPGKQADICAIDLSGPICQPCYNPLSHLAYVAGREQVSHVWVDGKQCVNNGALTLLHSAELKKTALLWQNRTSARPAV
ncbi:MAG: hypothetical protein RIR00_1579 [Pseudomonadota bacterium]|jgi:5-methylthioadenosine/S-adenosylhomocysteine deaminase